MGTFALADATGPAGRAGLAVRLGAVELARELARPRAQPSFLLCLLEDGRPCGHALIAHERCRLGVALLDVGVLTTVLDAPTLAAETALLEAAAAALEAAELPLLRMAGPPAHMAPSGLGPCALRADLWLAPSPGAAQAAVRYATVADAADLAALQSDTPPTPLAPQRLPTEWAWLLAGASVVLALDDAWGRLSAFVCLEEGAVVEGAAAEAGAARELLLSLAATGPGPLHLRLSAEHRLSQAALQLGGRLELRAPTPAEVASLWGVVDLGVALRQLLPELRRRLAASRYADWSGVLRLAGAGGAYDIVCAGGVPQIRAAHGPADSVVDQISLVGLAQLCLGYRSAADLRAGDALRCATVDLGLIDAFFSP